MKKRYLLGVFGILITLSYVLAVILSPLAYPGYDWMSQAVSDLSAQGAPSQQLWNRIATIYDIGSVVFLPIVCIFAKDRLNKLTKIGLYLFTLMAMISGVGYRLFPLSEVKFDVVMHIIVTVLVVLLSIASIIILMISGYKKKRSLVLAIYTTIVFACLMTSPFTGLVPTSIFGVIERFSTLGITSMYAFMGILIICNYNEIEINSLNNN